MDLSRFCMSRSYQMRRIEIIRGFRFPPTALSRCHQAPLVENGAQGTGTNMDMAVNHQVLCLWAGIFVSSASIHEIVASSHISFQVGMNLRAVTVLDNIFYSFALLLPKSIPHYLGGPSECPSEAVSFQNVYLHL